MTREEAIRDIKECLEDNKWGCGKYTEAFCWAIYALNEECVIEDIKAEIADMDGDINGYYIHKDDVLAIIDKHIGEKNEQSR